MWIYAVTRAVAERNGYEWGFNPIAEYDYYGGKPQMDFMDIDYGKIHNYTYKTPPSWQKYFWYEKYYHIDDFDYHPFQPDVFSTPDDTKLFIRCCQDARYLEDIKPKVEKWFSVKAENLIHYQDTIGINLDDFVILNVRGGEYRGIKELILNKKYWDTAIGYMKDRNPNKKFLCITDDIEYAKSILSNDIEVRHFSIGCDYYIINNAKELILSNSSFAIFPTWLNERKPFVIAPRYWARYNTSNGNWANSDIWTFGWNFLDREDGKLYAR